LKEKEGVPSLSSLKKEKTGVGSRPEKKKKTQFPVRYRESSILKEKEDKKTNAFFPVKV